MDVCFPGLTDPGPCLGWGTPVGVAINLAFWAGIIAFVVVAIRMVRAIRREWPVDSNDLERIMLTGPNPWLFFGTFILWFGAFIVANVAS